MTLKQFKTKTALAEVLAIALVALLLAPTVGMARAQAVVEQTREYLATAHERQEVLWFARALYSETKVAQEQVLVAWVIRNRVESPRFGDTYEEVVRAPNQFSGLNSTDEQYYINSTRTYDNGGDAWQGALRIAAAVYTAESTLRPFSKDVTHFYSPRSVATSPDWAANLSPVSVVRDTDKEEVRFAFYEGVR